MGNIYLVRMLKIRMLKILTCLLNNCCLTIINDNCFRCSLIITDEVIEKELSSSLSFNFSGMPY